MAKQTYELVDWKNESEGGTPVSSTNLKHMDEAIKHLYDEGATSKDIFICGENQTIDDAPEEAKIVFGNNTIMYIKNLETGELEKVSLPPTGDTFPIGMYGYFAGENAPTNWLRCDGQAVSRTEYKELFNAIGTTYGVGDGSTTFNLPNVNLENRTLVGSSGDGEFSVGNTGGEKTHKLTVAEMPNHNHPISGWVNSGAGAYFTATCNNTGTEYKNSAHTEATGGSQPHNNMPPFMASICCIKAKQSAGIVGDVTDNINDANENAVPNAKTVKDYVDKKQTYSNDETVIGTWLGQPLYRKVIDFGALPNNTNKNVAHGIAIDMPLKCYGTIYNPTTGKHFSIPWGGIETTLDDTNVVISTSSDRTAWTGKTIIEYTKTTD